MARPSRISPFTTKPLREDEIKKPLSTSTCKARDTVFRDRPSATAIERLGGTLAPAGTNPVRMECTIISLTRPCSVALLAENLGNSLTQTSVISCLCLMLSFLLQRKTSRTRMAPCTKQGFSRHFFSACPVRTFQARRQIHGALFWHQTKTNLALF